MSNDIRIFRRILIFCVFIIRVICISLIPIKNTCWESLVVLRPSSIILWINHLI